jgi:hypothetical protein
MTNSALFINSCYKFYTTTLPSLIESAKIGGVPALDIYVVVGESPEDTEFTFNGEYNIAFCRYTNEAYTAAVFFTQTQIGLSALSKYTHFFYMHDTCRILPGFWDKIYTHLHTCDSYIKLRPTYSKTIGLFNKDWFLENKKELMSYYANTCKELIMQYKDGDFPNKDEIYSKFSNLSDYLNEDCLFMFKDFVPIGRFFVNEKVEYFADVYGTTRLVSEYKDPGILKFQKNWGQGGGWKLDL